MDDRSPKILIVDDEKGTVETTAEDLRQEGGFKVLVRSPDELELEEVESADLILVDFQISRWPGRTAVADQIGLAPPDGLALSAILRRYAHPDQHTNPTAIAVITSEMAELCKPLPPDNRAHVVGRLTNLEWVFGKADEDLTARITALTKAVTGLPSDWPDVPDKRLELLKSMLGLAADGITDTLREQLLVDVLDCQPPLHDMSCWSHGLAFLRWLLQRVFSYPCFLMNGLELAQRFRQGPDQLEELLCADSPLDNALAPFRYAGIGAGFSDRKWWRSGVESFLWDGTERMSHSTAAIHGLLHRVTGVEVAESDSDPVIWHDEAFRPQGLDTCESCVRIRPDDWPAYALTAWARIDDVRDSDRLLSVVLPDDRQLIDA